MIDLEEEMRAAVSDFRKAAYEFAQSHHPEDHKSMMDAQVRIFALYRAAAAPQVVADERALPFLPKPAAIKHPTDDTMGCVLFSSQQMQDYARAALAAVPVDHACWSCKKPVTMDERSNADGDCPHCGAELDLDDWPAAAAPVQAQEPIGYVSPHELRNLFEPGSSRTIAILASPSPPDDFTVAIYRAPVQPVAVPHGWKKLISEIRSANTSAQLENRVGKLISILEAAPAAQIGATSHLIGEQIFNLATPYFLWTKDGAACDGWQHATAGVVGMPSLLSFARSLTDAIAAKAAS